MKHILSFIFATLLPMVASAFDAYIDGIYYNFSENNAIVTRDDFHDTDVGIYWGDVFIPESVTYNGKTYPVTNIDAYAFPYCEALISVTIPKSVTSIGSRAFHHCPNLTDVYYYAENVPETGSYVFSYTHISPATLHVPAGSVEMYKATEPWSGFGNIVALSDEFHQRLTFLEGNPIWVYKYERLSRAGGWKDGVSYGCFIDTNNRHFIYYFLGGQKEIDGKVYTMVGEITSRGEEELTVNRWLPVREENRIVYAITDSLPGLIEHDFLKNEIPYQQVGNECVLYNFRTRIGEALYPQNDYTTVHSYGTYQLMNGRVCHVLKTRDGDFNLYEKLGYLLGAPHGVMGPPYESVYAIGGDVYATRLNEYFGDGVMFYKAPDAQEGLCVNDTCWSRDDAEAYAPSYKADPRQEEVFSYIRQLQAATTVTFTASQVATIILPTAPDASKGKYYRLDRCEEGQIIFEQELHPQAHTPYIIVPSEDFSIDPDTLDLAGLSNDTVSVGGVSFIGSYNSEELNEPEGFYIDIIDTTPDCGFAPSEETGKGAFIGALRAYLQVRWDEPYNPGGSKVPGEKMGIVLRDYGTGISSLTPDPIPGREDEMFNSQRSMFNDIIYDLQGRKIATGKSFPLKGVRGSGIYIKDGRKMTSQSSGNDFSNEK